MIPASGVSGTVQTSAHDGCRFEDRNISTRQAAVAHHESSGGQGSDTAPHEIGLWFCAHVVRFLTRVCLHTQRKRALGAKQAQSKARRDVPTSYFPCTQLTSNTRFIVPNSFGTHLGQPRYSCSQPGSQHHCPSIPNLYLWCPGESGSVPVHSPVGAWRCSGTASGLQSLKVPATNTAFALGAWQENSTGCRSVSCMSCLRGCCSLSCLSCTSPSVPAR